MEMQAAAGGQRLGAGAQRRVQPVVVRQQHPQVQGVRLLDLRRLPQAAVRIRPRAGQVHPVLDDHPQQLGIHLAQDAPRLLTAPLVHRPPDSSSAGRPMRSASGRPPLPAPPRSSTAPPARWSPHRSSPPGPPVRPTRSFPSPVQPRAASVAAPLRPPPAPAPPPTGTPSGVRVPSRTGTSVTGSPAVSTAAQPCRSPLAVTTTVWTGGRCTHATPAWSNAARVARAQ